MAVSFQTPGFALKRINGLASLTADYSVCFWLRLGAAPTGGLYRTYFAIIDDPALSYTQYVWIGSDADTNNLAFGMDNGGGAVGTPAIADLPEDWVHLAYTRSGTTHDLYLNGILVDTQTLDVSANAQGAIYVADDLYSAPDLSIGYFREWTRALSAPEVAAEMTGTRARNLASLFTDTPLEGSLRDVSGQGHHWIPIGSPQAFTAITIPTMGGLVMTDCYSDHDMQDPGAYYGGFKEGLITSAGDVERCLSDPVTGQMKGGTSFTFSIIDKQRRFREQFAGPDKYWNQPIPVRMTTRANRAAFGVPYTVFVGSLLNAQPKEGLLWDFELGDLVSQLLLSDQAQVPWRKIGDGFIHDPALSIVVSENLDRDAAEPIIYGEHRRVPNIDVPSPQGFLYVPIYLGIESFGAADYHVGIICGHAISSVGDAFLCDFSDPTDPVLVSIMGLEGSTWLIAACPGYISVFGAGYQDRRSVTYGNIRRYSLVYGKVGEAGPDSWADGTRTLALALTGVEDVGDGSGAPILKRIQQDKHFCINYIAHHGLDSYQSGDWLTNPTWDILGASVPIVDEASFDAADAIADARLPEFGSPPLPVGYTGAAIINERSSVRRWWADWNRSCGYMKGFTRLGRIRAVMLHPTEAIKAAAPLYTDAYEILRGGFQPVINWDRHANVVPFKADYSLLNGVWMTSDVATADDSRTNWQRDIDAEVREYPFAPGITMAYHLARMEVLASKNPPNSAVLDATVGPHYNNQSLGYRDLGDYIRYRHYDAVSNAVDEIRLGLIVRAGVRVQRRRCFVELFDCEDLIGFDEPSLSSEIGSGGSPGSELNETCETAFDLGDLSSDFLQIFDTTLNAEDVTMTLLPGSPPHPAYHAKYFLFTAPANGQLTVGTLLTEYDTQLAVFTGSCGSLTLEEYNNDWTEGQLTSEIVMPVTSGTTYVILASSYVDEGGALRFGASFVAL